jgi:hypothetical protein
MDPKFRAFMREIAIGLRGGPTRDGGVESIGDRGEMSCALSASQALR